MLERIHDLAAFWQCTPDTIWSLTFAQFHEWEAHASRICDAREDAMNR